MRARKRVGERITVTSFNYQDINLEFEIVGMLPDGRYNQSAVMHRDYLQDALDDYEQKKKKKQTQTAQSTPAPTPACAPEPARASRGVTSIH